MNAVKIAAIALIVAGTLVLAYGSSSYTKETQEAKLGPIVLTAHDKKTINILVWACVGAIMIGSVLLLAGCHSGGLTGSTVVCHDGPFFFMLSIA